MELRVLREHRLYGDSLFGDSNKIFINCKTAKGTEERKYDVPQTAWHESLILCKKKCLLLRKNSYCPYLSENIQLTYNVFQGAGQMRGGASIC